MQLKLRVVLTVSIFCLFLSPSAVSAWASGDDWSQYGHDAGRTSATNAVGPLWPELVEGWPVFCDNCRGGAVITRVSTPAGKGAKAVLLASDEDRKLYGFDTKGRPLPGWPLQLGQPYPCGEPLPSDFCSGLTMPAAHWQNGQTRIYASDNGTMVYGVDQGGDPLTGYPWDAGDGQFRAYPSMLPLNEAEALGDTVGISFREFNPLEGQLYLLRDGAPQPGWPRSLSANSDYYLDSWFSGPAIAENGSAYAAGSGSGSGSWALYGFDLNGNSKPGWPLIVDAPRYGFYLPYLMSGPAVAKDGTVLVTATGDPDLDPGTFVDTETMYFALTPEGDARPGWPTRIPGAAFGTPAVADNGVTYLSITEYPEEDMRTHAVYAFNRDGSVRSGWPKRFKGRAPLISPEHILGLVVDGNGNVFFGQGNTVYGYDQNGGSLPGWPLKLQGARYPALPSLADDGTLYISVSGGVILAFKQGGPPAGNGTKGTKLSLDLPKAEPPEWAKDVPRSYQR